MSPQRPCRCSTLPVSWGTLRHQKLDVISFLKLNSWLWLPSGCSTQWLILVLMWKDLSSSSKMEELSTTWMSSCTLPSCCYHIPNPFSHYDETTIHTCSISLTEAWTGCSMFRTHLPECTPGNTSSPPESPIKSSSPTNLYMPLLLVLFRPSQLNVYSPFESSALLPARSGNTLPFPL